MEKPGWSDGRKARIEIFDARGGPQWPDEIVRGLVQSSVEAIVGGCTPEAKRLRRLMREKLKQDGRRS